MRLLIVDDQYPDAELSAHQIARSGYPCTWRRVETEAEFRKQLREFEPHLILSDFSMPQYDGLSALELAKSEAPEVPFIFVSGTIGEKRATEALTRGAADYVSKRDLTRLAPAVRRVMNDPGAPASREASRGLEQRLRIALKERQFTVYYQPLIERVSGRIAAVEALLRWRDPHSGMISPGLFLPTLEETGLIIPVGEWVLSKTLQDFARWRSIGLPKIRVAVNMSSTELGRRGFADYFLNAARLARTSAGIDIEITEGALLDNPENLRQNLKSLRAEGVRVAIDDFGMVHSSLSRLSEFPVDSLKIDRAFISHLSARPQSQLIVSTIIATARTYGLRTVAQGVETIEQLEILDRLGCEQSQGYLHSPPVSAEDLELLVASRATEAQP